MTFVEQNQIIKDAITRQIQEKGRELPEDIGSKFAAWVKGIIKATRDNQQMVKQMQEQGGNA